MPNLRDLRRRIKSIKNTSQITRAMQMVSATKMRKAQSQALSARPYWQTLLQAVVGVAEKVRPEIHPLLNNSQPENGRSKVGILAISSDRGLCGSLNTNIFRLLQNIEQEKKGEELVFYTVGKKVRDFVARSGKNLQADFTNPEHVNFGEAVKIRKLVVEAFLSGEVSRVSLVYPRFITTLRQEVKFLQLLPIRQEVLLDVLSLVRSGEVGEKLVNGEVIFEPNADEVLDFALLHLLDTRIYQALLETRASEHSARMIAMQNATDNAKELVSDLTLTYNQLRQDAITKELLEITSAASALE